MQNSGCQGLDEGGMESYYLMSIARQLHFHQQCTNVLISLETEWTTTLVNHTLKNKDSNFYVDIYFTTIKTKQNETSTTDSALLLYTEQCPEPGIDCPACLTFSRVKPMLLGIVGKALGNLTPPTLMASAFPQTLSSGTALTRQTKCTVLWTK